MESKLTYIERYTSDTLLPTLPNIDSIFCGICKNIMLEEIAELPECAHVFCQRCLDFDDRINNRKQCPICRKPFLFYSISKRAAKDLKNIMIKCYHPECNVSFPISDIANHQLTCFYEQDSCPHCKSNFIRKELWTHLISCPEIVIKCNVCVMHFKRKDEMNHNAFHCPKRKIKCSCGVDLLQEAIGAHQAICPKASAPCMYSTLQGIQCPFVGVRERLVEHEKDSQYHSNLLMQRLRRPIEGAVCRQVL
jgi:hypothetical protein